MALTDAKIRQLNRMKNLINLLTAATCFCSFTLTARATGDRFLGKEKTLALGVYPEVSLSEAREKRDAARKQIAEELTRANRNEQRKLYRRPAILLSLLHVSGIRATKNGPKLTEKVLKSLETHVFLYRFT
jgi:hypothetical protein